MATMSGEQAFIAALGDVHCIAEMLKYGRELGLIREDEVEELKPLVLQAFYQWRVNRGELEPR